MTSEIVAANSGLRSGGRRPDGGERPGAAPSQSTCLPRWIVVRPDRQLLRGLRVAWTADERPLAPSAHPGRAPPCGVPCHGQGARPDPVRRPLHPVPARCRGRVSADHGDRARAGSRHRHAPLHGLAAHGPAARGARRGSEAPARVAGRGDRRRRDGGRPGRGRRGHRRRRRMARPLPLDPGRPRRADRGSADVPHPPELGRELRADRRDHGVLAAQGGALGAGGPLQPAQLGGAPRLGRGLRAHGAGHRPGGAGRGDGPRTPLGDAACAALRPLPRPPARPP